MGGRVWGGICVASLANLFGCGFGRDLRCFACKSIWVWVWAGFALLRLQIYLGVGLGGICVASLANLFGCGFGRDLRCFACKSIWVWVWPGFALLRSQIPLVPGSGWDLLRLLRRLAYPVGVGTQKHARIALRSYIAPSLARSSKLGSPVLRLPHCVRGVFLRRGWDSNPRYGETAHTLSRRAPSATRAPLRGRAASNAAFNWDVSSAIVSP
jgi:hypothetical protein